MTQESRKSIAHRLAQEQLYRLQAKRVAAQAQNSSDPKIKKTLTDIADQYQHLADSIAHGPLL